MRKDTILRRIHFVLVDPRFSLLDRLEYVVFLGLFCAALGLAVYSLGYVLWEFELPRQMGWAAALTLVLALFSGRVNRRFTIPFYATTFEKGEAEELLRKNEHWMHFPGGFVKGQIGFGLWAAGTMVLVLAVALLLLFPPTDIAERLGVPELSIDVAAIAVIILIGAVGIFLATRASWLPLRDWLRSEPGQEKPSRWREVRIWILAVVISLALVAYLCARQGALEGAL